MGKSTAAPVDFQAAALAEGEASRDIIEAQTWANRPNQSNPWGDINWSTEMVWDPATQQNINQWTQTQTLSPELQAALAAQMGLQQGRSELGYGMMNRITGEIGAGMDWGSFGDMHGVGQHGLMTDANAPSMWSHLQWDIPQYSTTPTLEQLNFANAPDVMAPQFGVQRAEDAIYSRGQNRLDQKFQGERQALEVKMRNQGLVPGDEAWDSQMQNQAIKENDAYQALTNESIMGAGREAERMFGMESGYRDQYTGEVQRAGDFANQAAQQMFNQNMMAGSQGFRDTQSAAEFQNRARQQSLNELQQMMGYNQNLDFRMADYYNRLRQEMINEAMTRRGFSLNEANALISGQQVGLPQMSGFSQAGAAQTPQLLQAANLTGQQNAAMASADNAMMNSLMGGLGSAAGFMGMFSDRRLKRNIKPIGKMNGQQWYSFEYIWGQPAIGVMADEAPPEAVFEHPSGFLMVDYSKV